MFYICDWGGGDQPRTWRWGVCHVRKPWAWWRSWTPSPKCLRATWRRQPLEEQVSHSPHGEDIRRLLINPVWHDANDPVCLIHSVPDSLQCHGSPGYLRVLCLQRHLDEIRVWSWQGLFQVSVLLSKRGRETFLHAHKITAYCRKWLWDLSYSLIFSVNWE